MMRVNLLPPEILERRRAERRMVYVAFAFIGVVIVLAGVYVVASMNVSSKQTVLDQKTQLLATTTQKAEALQVFELQESELQRRRSVASMALDARRDWSRLLDEVSLVMPADMWLITLNVGETEGAQLDGYAVDPEDSPDYGHKTIAKLLVRLADLDQLYDVWLTNSVATLVEEQPALQFSITAGVEVPASTASTTTPSP
ncbi:MAG: PilN domain-containing protein [Actinomycetia bacterium]|nr:PilN domain-containing protein [Actinomycetes bacterium]